MKIYCYECDPPKEFKMITERHLKLVHNMSIDEYKNKYPGKKLYSKRTKTILCSNSTEDNKHYAVVDINISNSLAICDDCRKVGYKIKNWNEETVIKRKETFLKKSNGKYTNTSQFSEVKQKKVKTSLKNNGTINPMKNPNIVKKGQDTLFRRTGRTNPMLVEEYKQKQQNTLFSNWGVIIPLKNLELVKNMVNTQIRLYGGIGTGSKITKKKIDDTVYLRYKVDNISKAEVVKNKRLNTFMNNWDAINPSCTEEGKIRIKKGLLKFFIPRLKRMLEYMKLEIINMHEYEDCYQMLEFHCKVCNNIFKQRWNYVQTYYLCPICHPRKRGRGSKEIEVYNFVYGLGFNSIVPNDRKTITPYEIDILINDVNIGIEFNELIGHSEVNGKGPKYHLDKTLLADDSGVRLIHIFEDEWMYKRDIIMHLLKNILNKSDSERIHARQCIIREITPSDKNKFLDEFHLQGKDSSNIKLGAFYNNKLISVMTFSYGSISKGSYNKDKTIFELNRFCSDYNYKIPGIASKLLSHFKKNYEWTKIYSFADLRWSVGNLYKTLNFKLEKTNPPSYHYVKQIKDPMTNETELKRLHRFTLRKTKEESQTNLTEVELRFKQGYYRIWDCGNLKFTLKNE